MAQSENEYRLPPHILPHHYDLDIVTNLELNNFNFNGVVKIKVECVKPTNVIKVHARDMQIDDNVTVTPAEIRAPQGDLLKPIQVKDTELDTTNEFFVINVNDTLAAGYMYIINISFRGLLGDDLVGYYRSSFYEHSSQSVKWLAVTQFEPTEARQAFPCFDEPAMKATFTIRLGHKEQFNSISNMPLLKTVPFEGREGWVWNEFQPSVPMSTYLIGYVVSEFKPSQGETPPNSNVQFQVWSRPEALEQSDFAAKVGPLFLSYYQDFFNIKYPLPKQDLVAIPDFKLCAMENWGIITFRESILLLDYKYTSNMDKWHIASVIAHELAHMWFGNLVTMYWWSDLWLKEGFATYMAGLNIHHGFPEWNSLDIESIDTLLAVLEKDSLQSSHPVSVHIHHPNEISQVFDSISYKKGSYLLRMMSLFLGEEVFRHGVSEYLKNNQYKNAEQDDLWAYLTEQAHRYHALPAEVTVKQIMDTWTLQTGYPLIIVTRDYENRKVTVSQRRYLAVKSGHLDHYKGSWWVPLSYSTRKEPLFNQTQPQYWLRSGEESMQFDITAEEQDWFILNNRAAGLYRVNYDKTNWLLLVEALHSDHYNVDALNRAQILIDMMDLAHQGLIDYELAFMAISYLRNETELVPWRAALTRLEPLDKLLSRTSSYGAYKKLLVTLLTPIVIHLGKLSDVPESFEKAELLNIVAQWACRLNVGTWGTEAQELINKWRKSSNPDIDNVIPKDVRKAIYAYGASTGGEQLWDFLWERYVNTNLSTERYNILGALASTKEPWLLKRYLEWSIDETTDIRKQDSYIVFREVALRPHGHYIAREFFLHNFQKISEYLGGRSNVIERYFLTIGEQSVFEYELLQLSEFAKTHEEILAQGSLAVAQSLESIQGNINWMNNHYTNISVLLLQYPAA